jgi:uncharacterized protein (TIGR03118 family)
MRFQVKKLVSNIPGLAQYLDADLKNPSNLIEFDGKLYVAILTNVLGKSVVKEYQLNGELIQNIESINTVPYGITKNDSKYFVIEKDVKKAASEWIVVGNGAVAGGYNKIVDLSKTVGVSINIGPWTSCTQKDNRLYLSLFDFEDDGDKTIYLVDGQWKSVGVGGVLPDNTIPNDYSISNVKVIGNELFALYSKIDDDSIPVVGAGFGYIAVFDLNGVFIRYFVSQGELNAPWAIVKAPKSFEKFKCKYLVGNFGDGKINAYNKKGVFLGTLKDKYGDAIVLDKLVGLEVYDEKLYFVSHPNSESSNGLLGYIETRHC